MITALDTRSPSAASALLLELAQDEGGDLGRRESALAELDADDRFAAFRDAEREELQFVLHVVDAAAHQPLDGVDGAVGCVDQQAARGVADDHFAVWRQRHHAGTSLSPSSPGMTSGRVQVHPGDQAVGGAEVDADDAVVRLPKSIWNIGYCATAALDQTSLVRPGSGMYFAAVRAAIELCAGFAAGAARRIR